MGRLRLTEDCHELTILCPSSSRELKLNFIKRIFPLNDKCDGRQEGKKKGRKRGRNEEKKEGNREKKRKTEGNKRS